MKTGVWTQSPVAPFCPFAWFLSRGYWAAEGYNVLGSGDFKSMFWNLDMSVSNAVIKEGKLHRERLWALWRREQSHSLVMVSV